ncbi:MAG: hypothetical protein UT24_C0047G0008, partial [Candidatus Woesebacteria bacterium GW2011_GWB1_39_12]
RCFWIERKLGKAPSIFPGIFSTLDSLTKKSVKRSYLERNCLPEWLPIKNAARPIEFPRISVPMLKYGNWILTGDPDEVLEMNDGSYHIVDYKTAKFTTNFHFSIANPKRNWIQTKIFVLVLLFNRWKLIFSRRLFRIFF